MYYRVKSNADSIIWIRYFHFLKEVVSSLGPFFLGKDVFILTSHIFHPHQFLNNFPEHLGTQKPTRIGNIIFMPMDYDTVEIHSISRDK